MLLCPQLRLWDGSIFEKLRYLEVFFPVSQGWDRFWVLVEGYQVLWRFVDTEYIHGHGWCPKPLWSDINWNCLSWSRHWGRATQRQFFFRLRFYWRGYSETGVWRLNNWVYVQNLDDLVVCTGKFVDSVLNCSWAWGGCCGPNG